MNNWILTVSKKRVGNKVLEPYVILRHRLGDKFWGFRQHTLKRRDLVPGDRVVFYLGIPIKAFAASAILASSPFELSEEQKNKYSHSNSLYESDYGVLLRDIQLWDKPKAVKHLIQDLKFIEDKDNWGAYFQGGIRQLSEEDFQTIARGD